MTSKYLLLMLFIFNSCIQTGSGYADDITLYKNSPVAELAEAVGRGNTERMKEILSKEQVDIDYKEPKFGMSLLNWTVYNERYDESKVLIDYGADPYVVDDDGSTVLMEAAKLDMMVAIDRRMSSKFISLCLGSEFTQQLTAEQRKRQLGKALLYAVGSDLESVKLLVEAGANVNFFNEDSTESPLGNCLIHKKVGVAKYLIIKGDANFDSYIKKMAGFTPGKIRIIELFRHLAFPLGSGEHQIKMELVSYMKERGVNYWETEIPKKYLNEYDEEYLSKY